MYGHFNDVISSIRGKQKSDTFTRHMVAHFGTINDKKIFTATQLRPYVSTRVIWQGNYISCNKSFSTLRCTLCMQECLDILKLSNHNPTKLMKSRSEMYGACRHVVHFHRYCIPTTTVSTDDRGNKTKITL